MLIRKYGILRLRQLWVLQEGSFCVSPSCCTKVTLTSPLYQEISLEITMGGGREKVNLADRSSLVGSLGH